MSALFYLGTHCPNWLAQLEVPLFVSRRRLFGMKKLPRAKCRWALDSGGFTELGKYGKWMVTPEAYAQEVRRFRDEIGNLQWAAPQDWMCEPHMLKKTGLTVLQHQANTIRNYLDLRWIAPDEPWVPVLQGWEHADYLRHVSAYAAAGVDLTKEPVVGIGSVCRRQSTKMVEALVSDVAGLGIRLHGFGFKTLGLQNCNHLLTSSDSMAWSFAARKQAPLPGHEARHRNCANCQEFALQWRARLLATLDNASDEPKQSFLNFYGKGYANDAEACGSAA